MSSHSELAQPILEQGWNSAITINGGEVIKISPLATVYDTRTAAENVAADLAHYAASLEQQPLRIVPLHGVDVVEHPEGYKVQHRYEQIQGPSLTRLPAPARQEAMRDLLAQVGDMDTFADQNTLVVPFDAKSDNFHIDHNGPVLTDIFPAVLRTKDGSFPYHMFADSRKARLFEWTMGTKSGAMTALLSTAIDRGNSPSAKLKHISRNTDSWAYDALPSGLSGQVRDEVRKQISRRFVPFMGRVASHKVQSRIRH